MTLLQDVVWKLNEIHHLRFEKALVSIPSRPEDCKGSKTLILSTCWEWSMVA